MTAHDGGESSIALSFRNQFVPSIGYTYTFEKGYGPHDARRLVWQNSLTSAGNILSGLLSLFGERQPQYLLGNRFRSSSRRSAS